MKFKNIALSMAAVAMFASGSALAGYGTTFTVDSGTIFGESAALFDANRFSLTWTSLATQFSSNGKVDGINSDIFTEKGSFDASVFLRDNVQVLSAESYLGFRYKLIGTFEASGTSSLFTGASGVGINAQYDTFDLKLSLQGLGAYAGNTFDLGMASLIPGSGSESNMFVEGVAKGDYHVKLAFDPTADGSTFFINPFPFILNLDLTGVLNEMSAKYSDTYFDITKSGDGSAWVSDVPEPASLALFGIGLLGLVGLLRRHHNKVINL